MTYRNVVSAVVRALAETQVHWIERGLLKVA